VANGASRRGHQRERDLVNWFRNNGFFAMRSPASLGAVDVVVIPPDDRPLFIEVKSTSRSAFAGFPPRDREELLRIAKIANAVPLLCWHPPRGARRFYGAHEWP